MKKILIAEDDSTMLSLLCTLLELEGFLPIAYNENEKIVETVRREMPDIVLLDIHMDFQDGIEVTKQIKNDLNLSSIFVVLQSGMELGVQSVNAGANAFLLKPYMPESLFEILKSV